MQTPSPETIAGMLLQIKAIKLNPANPFTWASQWRSPIYCDNRKVLSHVEARNLVADGLAETVKKLYPNAEVVAGVATGAIAHGVLVAERLGLPFIYVRSSPKSHGMGNQIEGEWQKGAKVVVIEDLISTGGSSISAVEALRDGGCDVAGMVAIFSYGFDAATENFARADVKVDTLCNYNALIKKAAEAGYVTAGQLDTLAEWRTDPANWGR